MGRGRPRKTEQVKEKVEGSPSTASLARESESKAIEEKKLSKNTIVKTWEVKVGHKTIRKTRMEDGRVYSELVKVN